MEMKTYSLSVELADDDPPLTDLLYRAAQDLQKMEEYPEEAPTGVAPSALDIDDVIRWEVLGVSVDLQRFS